MRNHGFLLTKNGWQLSPAYDINPDERGTGLSLNISEFDNSLDFDLVLSVAEYFRRDIKEAKSFIGEIKKAVSKWPVFATKLNISKMEQRPNGTGIPSLKTKNNQIMKLKEYKSLEEKKSWFEEYHKVESSKELNDFLTELPILANKPVMFRGCLKQNIKCILQANDSG